MTARKTTGIRARGRGKWEVVVELDADPVSGERRRAYFQVHGTKADAETLLTAKKYERDHGVEISPERLTVAELLRQWLRDQAAVQVAPSTLKRYGQLVDRIIALIGTERAQALRPAHVQRLQASLLQTPRAPGKPPLAPRTVLHHSRVLREALSWAVKMGLLSVNPALAVDAPRPQRTEMATLDEAGVERVLTHCRSAEQRTIVFTALQTGLRLGELLGLKWDDIDFASGRAAIVRSNQYLDRQVTFRPPKTARGRRSIALSPATLDALRAHRQCQREARLRSGGLWEDSGLVFTDAIGRPLRGYNVSANFKAVAKAAGVPDGFRFHDLRHSAASLALRAGVHVKVVSERLGHASVQITLDTYSHVLPDLQAEAAQRMDAFIRMPDAAALPG